MKSACSTLGMGKITVAYLANWLFKSEVMAIIGVPPSAKIRASLTISAVLPL
ncbi:hypothetical protein P7G41_07920 [Enterococcus faecalis]|nr:hypothetical protein [Enterococcus faecalis]MDT2113831.1 hypothetical protein [Enterococcus faecalis]